MASKDKVILEKLYPKIASCMDKNLNKYKQCVGRFMESRREQLYAVAPFDRIYFGQDDIDDFFKSVGITEKEVKDVIDQTYYAGKANFNPRCAKDPFTIAVITIARYFYIKNDDRNMEITMVYLAFSGKFYPSIHSGSFPKVTPRQYEHVMLYVVNNMLSQKFDLKREGTVFGAVRSICNTWKTTYASKFKDFEDEDVVYLLQQLHNRLKSFMQNIAELYYKAYEEGLYITYDGDNLDDNNFHLADSDIIRANRNIEAAMTKLSTSSVDFKTCQRCANTDVKTDEIKSIMEGILSDPANRTEIKELVNLLVYDYYAKSNKKDIKDIEFISYSISPKPNTRDKNIIREKEIIESWLDENSPQYRKRKSRIATKNSYYKAVLYYFVLVIYEANV